MASIFSDSPNAACLLVLLLETTIGVVLSVIVIGLLLKLKGANNMGSGNIIRISISTSNVFFSITVFASVFSGVLGPGNVAISNSISSYIVYSLNIFSLSSSSWLTAVISFLYFIKIVDLKVRAVVWTKKNIDAIIPWMILSVEVVAFLSSFLVMLLCSPSDNTSINNSMIHINNSLSHNTDMRFMVTILAVSCMPFFIIMVTTIYAAITLKNHSNNMMKSTFNDKQMKRFGKTTFKIKRLLLIYSSYYLLAMLFYLSFAFHLTIEFWIFMILLSSFTMVQSVFLILGNPKLEEAAKEILKCAVCFSKTRS